MSRFPGTAPINGDAAKVAERQCRGHRKNPGIVAAGIEAGEPLVIQGERVLETASRF